MKKIFLSLLIVVLANMQVTYTSEPKIVTIEQKLDVLADAFTKPFFDLQNLQDWPKSTQDELYGQLNNQIYELLQEKLDEKDIDVMYNYYASNANQKMLSDNKLDNIYSEMQNKIDNIKKCLIVTANNQEKN